MSLRGEFIRVLKKHKSGSWTTEKSADALEKYFKKHLPFDWENGKRPTTWKEARRQLIRFLKETEV